MLQTQTPGGEPGHTCGRPERHAESNIPHSSRRRPVVCLAAADLTAETVQQQVQEAERSVDALVGLLHGQPAEGSAAGAPGEVPALPKEEVAC